MRAHKAATTKGSHDKPVLFFLRLRRRHLLPVCVGFEKKDLAARVVSLSPALCENCEHLIGE